MKKKIVMSLVTAMMLSALGGVSVAAEEKVPGDRNGDGEFTIAFVNYDISLEFFAAVQESMERACKENNVKLLTDTSNGDEARLRELWDLYCAQGADIIIDFSLLPESGGVLATMYQEQGKCPVISVDNEYEGAYFFGVNNQLAGEIAGACLEEGINKRWNGEIDICAQLYSDNVTLEPRNKGASDHLIEAGLLTEDQIEWILCDIGYVIDGTGPSAQAYMQDRFTAHPEEDNIVVMVVNDEAANGVLMAAEAVGRTDDVIIVSHGPSDMSISNLKAEEESSWYGTIDYNSNAYGDQLVELALRICNGEEVDDHTYAICTAVTRDNVWEKYPE